MKREEFLIWINSAGGPLILLEESLLKHWHGFNLADDPDYITDYNRACEINEFVGIIPVVSGYGLVFGGEPFQTAWLPFPEAKNGLLVCWNFAENESAVMDALNNLQSVKWEKTDIEIKFSGDKLILFDSALPGSEINEKLEIEIPAGRYLVETAHHLPNKETSLIIHHFKKL